MLMLGFEELMYAPLRLAEALADALPDVDVRYSTTTRSPVVPVDDAGYAIRTRLAFPAHDDPADGPGSGTPTTSPLAPARAGSTGSCSWWTTSATPRRSPKGS